MNAKIDTIPKHLAKAAREIQGYSGIPTRVVERITPQHDLRVFGGDARAGIDDRNINTFELYAVGELKFPADTEISSCGYTSGEFRQPCELLFMGDSSSFGLDKLITSTVATLAAAKIKGDVNVMFNYADVWQALMKNRKEKEVKYSNDLDLVLFRFTLAGFITLTPCRLC